MDKKAVGVILGIVGVATIVLIATAAPKEICCPYCGQCFPSIEELQEHILNQHPNERIPIVIDWD